MLTDLELALGEQLLAGANQLRKWAYKLYEKADDLHYFLEKWHQVLHTETWPA